MGLFKHHKEIDGETWYRVREGLTKKEAERSAAWQRKGGFRARVIKVRRGNYDVYTR